MCVVADTDNKVGRTKIDPRGKISLFVGLSTQHAGDVYRLLNPKMSRVIWLSEDDPYMLYKEDERGVCIIIIYIDDMLIIGKEEVIDAANKVLHIFK